jgi:hypothetical protein
MSSTYSTTLRIELIGNGDQSGTWGDTTNTNLGDLIEAAITGVQAITMSDANYTMTAYNGLPDESRNAVLVVSGTNTAIRSVIAPSVEKTYLVKNNTTGGYGVTIRTSSGTGVTVASGTTVLVYCDGTEFYQAAIPSGSTTGTGSVVYSTSPTITTPSISSPTLTGTPVAPTASAGTNTTQIATTAFVLANGLPSGSIVIWSGSAGAIPSGFYLCNGSNGTPDLRNRFVVGAGSTYSVGDTGGSANAIVVSHTHTASVTDPGHFHTVYANPGGGSGAFGGGSSGGATNINSDTKTTGITVGISTEGASGTNANLPPYYALCYIMKA